MHKIVEREEADPMESEEGNSGEVLGGEAFVVRRGGMVVTAMVNLTPETASARRGRGLVGG